MDSDSYCIHNLGTIDSGALFVVEGATIGLVEGYLGQQTCERRVRFLPTAQNLNSQQPHYWSQPDNFLK